MNDAEADEIPEHQPKPALPKAVFLQDLQANRLISDLKRARERAAPKIGRPKRSGTSERYLAFTGDSIDDIDSQMRRFYDLLGPRNRGNKRWGRVFLYYDLFNHFVLLDQRGITLPRGNELSASAFKYGLAEILHAHHLTSISTKELLANSAKRKVIARKMKRVFERVATAVRKTPVHK